MTVQYKGKSPSRFWYGLQRIKAIGATFGDKSTKSEAKCLGRNSALSVGSAVAGYTAYSSIVFLGVPTLLGVAGFAACCWFGVQAYHSLNALKRTDVYNKYTRTQEDAWLEKQSRPELGTRIGNFFSKAGKVLGYVAAAAGLGVAGAGILEYTGEIGRAHV